MSLNKMIEQFFLKCNTKENEITDKLFYDLDIDKVFKKLDSTKSAIGKQYLYYTLRTPNFEYKKIISRELLIASVSKADIKNKINKLLSGFIRPHHFLLPNIIYDNYKIDVGILKYSYLTVPLMLISISLIKFSWVFIAISGILALINSTLYFINKFRIQQLIDVVSCYFDFAELVHSLKYDANIQASKIVDLKYRSLLKGFSRFLLERNIKSGFIVSEMEVMIWSLIEIISSIFCLEFFFLEFFLVRLSEDKSNLLHNYLIVGEIDIALSISEFRLDSKTCIPTFNENNLDVKEISHPLIDNCSTNSIKIEDKGVVINGANMSGKTSFIKTIAINQVLFQTINTCFAKSYSAPLYNIYSMINVSDNIVGNVSYFKNEIDGYKEIMNATSQSTKHNLIIIDEPLKGTNVDYSTAISFGVIQKLSENKKNMIIVTTHSFELSDLLEKRLEFERYCFNEYIEKDELKYDYKLKKGLIVQYNPINLLRANNYPLSVIEAAESVYLKKHKNNSNFYFDKVKYE